MSPTDKVDDILRLIDDTLDELSGAGGPNAEHVARGASPFPPSPVVDRSGVRPSV